MDNNIYHNFNHDQWLSIEDIPCGKHHRLIIKIGRKKYYMDINKDKLHAYIELYDYVPDSKYNNSNLHGIWVNSNAYIDKVFLLNIDAIEKAERIVERYRHELTIFSYV